MIPKRIVIDTNVCLDLFAFQDPRWNKLLEALQNGQLLAVTTSDCRDEWLAVLKYPHLPVTDENKDRIMSDFDRYISCIAPAPKSEIRLPICTDKDDQKFLELARDAEVDALITKDKALLKLARKMRVLGLARVEVPEKFIAQMDVA
jgi:putative PIN family toxin of toxin-antitoxin system